VQQTGYAPTAAALDNQKKYNSEFRKQYGGDPNDPEFLRSLAANQALAGSATDCEFFTSFLPPSPLVILGVALFWDWLPCLCLVCGCWSSLSRSGC
jgi:hypothetical protein